MDSLIQDLTTMKDDTLVELIRAYDHLGKPLDKRVFGDDDALFFLMDRHGYRQNVVDKVLVMSVVMRVALERGLKVSLES